MPERRVGLVGARGHVGAELVRLLSAHPRFELVFVSSRALAGQPVPDAAPLCFEDLPPEAVAERDADAVVLALPNDLSEPYVRALARASGVRIVLVRAVLAHTFPGTDPTDAQAAAVQQAEDELAAVAERLWADGLAAERHVYYGEASEAILETAHYQRGDLIAMSTHGRTGLGRWVYGSVADRVLQRATVPLLLVPATAERAWPTDRPPRFLVPLDGSEFAEAALQPASELAATLGAELVLLRVVEPLVPLVADETVYGSAFKIEEEHAAAGEYLERVAAPLRAQQSQTDTPKGRCRRARGPWPRPMQIAHAGVFPSRSPL